MTFKKIKSAIRWPYFAAAFALFSLAPLRSLADVDDFVRLIGGALWTFFVQPFVWLLELEFELLKWIASYNGFTSQAGVTIGWIALRDLSNMFFILILLVIAFATILRISSYGYQQLLRRTIIVAILINFSKSIVGFMIDVVQVVMLTFISAINEVMTGGIVVAIGLYKFTTINPEVPVADYGDYIISLLLGAAFVMITVVVIGVMVMMLMMRIVALWIAIIMAPLAFLASIFPVTQSFYNTWTRQLGTNLVTGPMLAFFLWLTLNIVGNGNAANGFVSESGGSTGPTEFLDAANMMNYVIAIALLLMGIKMAASSGAAGAKIAEKGMKKIQDTAGHIARRYPKALAMRAGNLASKGIIDKDGNMRGKFGKFIGKTPFYGGRLQRAAQKMQGRNAARIQAEKAEDEKNLLPQHRVAFQKTYGEGAADKKGFQKLYSRIGSWGGDKEREAMMYQDMQARGEITSEHADAATDAFRRMGLEEEMQKVQLEHGTYENKEEAIRLIQKQGGIGAVISNLKADSFMKDTTETDENGKLLTEEYEDPETGEIKTRTKQVPTKSMDHLIDAISDPKHGYSDHNAISAATLKMDKVDRWAFNDMLRNRLNREGSFEGKMIDDDGGKGMTFDKRGGLTAYLANQDLTRAIALGQTYVQKPAAQTDEEGNITDIGAKYRHHMAAHEQLKDGKFQAGNIGSSMPDIQDQDGIEMAERRRVAEIFDRINKGTKVKNLPEFLRERFAEGMDGEATLDDKAFADFEDFRQDMYKQLVGEKAWTLDPTTSRREYKEAFGTEDGYDDYITREDYGDTARVFKDDTKTRKEQMMEYILANTNLGISRSDLESQKDTLAKESPEGLKSRKKAFAKATDPEEAERIFNEKLDALEKIEAIRDNSVGEKLAGQYEKRALAKGASPEQAKKAGEQAVEDIIVKMSADQVGDERLMYDLATRSFDTELTDGAHGSRFMEANVNDRWEAVTLKQALERSENQQQAQAFSVAIGAQAPFLLNTLAELGKLPQKILMDNSSKSQAAIAMQKYRDVNHYQNEGKLPQDLGILGSNIKQLAAVIRSSAIYQGYAKEGATGKALAQGVKKYLEANKPAKDKLESLAVAFNKPGTFDEKFTKDGKLVVNEDKVFNQYIDIPSDPKLRKEYEKLDARVQHGGYDINTIDKDAEEAEKKKDAKKNKDKNTEDSSDGEDDKDDKKEEKKKDSKIITDGVNEKFSNRNK